MAKRNQRRKAKSDTSAASGLWAASTSIAGLPFKIAGRIAQRTLQVVLALFVVVLHPQLRWLARVIGQSAFVQRIVKPSFQGVISYVYEPYIAFLKTLPPLWATISIAVPLAVLEPAKFAATITIARYPKLGIALWLILQAVGFVLIDKTWAAVRPQARKIWLVSRLHAWLWLNIEYGKHWIKTSAIYTGLMRLKKTARQSLRVFFARLARRRGRA